MSKTLYINGEWKTPVDGHTWDVISPADGHVVATVAEATGADVELAISAARKAFDAGDFPSWGFEKRSALVGKIADLMERDLNILAKFYLQDTFHDSRLEINSRYISDLYAETQIQYCFLKNLFQKKLCRIFLYLETQFRLNQQSIYQ